MKTNGDPASSSLFCAVGVTLAFCLIICLFIHPHWPVKRMLQS